MQFDLPAELAELQATVRKLAQERIAPRAREIDTTGEYPQDLFDLFVDAGLTGLCIPEELGGAGAGILGLTVAIEEVSKYSQAAALMLLLTRLPTGPVMIAGNAEQQQRRYVTPIATGEARAAFGLSEPQAGSDVMGMRTPARPDGDDWVLTGTKCWMSGVRQADWYCVFAKTGPVDSGRTTACRPSSWSASGRASTSVGVDRKMGVKGVDTGELLLDEVRVPAENVVGEIGGFRLAMLGLNSMRPIVAAGHRSRRRRAHVRGRVREATPGVRAAKIADFQGIQWKIAGARDRDRSGAVAHVSRRVDGRPREFTKEWVPFLSMAKYYATELAVKVSGEALQMLGAAGYMKDHPLELYYRDAKQLTIVEGTTQVQLGLIAAACSTMICGGTDGREDRQPRRNPVARCPRAAHASRGPALGARGAGVGGDPRR